MWYVKSFGISSRKKQVLKPAVNVGESAQSAENFFGPPKIEFFLGGRTLQQNALCNTTNLLLRIESAWLSLPWQQRPHWPQELLGRYIGSYISHPKSWGDGLPLPPRFQPLEKKYKNRTSMHINILCLLVNLHKSSLHMKLCWIWQNACHA